MNLFRSRRVVAVAHMAQHCELVWVRCREPRDRLLAAAPRGMRVSIVEKCGEHGQGTALEAANVGEEGFGYASWIVSRWTSLPACAFLVHGGWERRPAFWDNAAAVLGCVRRPLAWAANHVAIALSHHWREGRMLIGSGLGAFDRHLRDSGIIESVFPNVRDRPLGYYATNSWLVSRAALQHSMKPLWETLRNASLLPNICLLYTSPSPRDRTRSRMPSSA